MWRSIVYIALYGYDSHDYRYSNLMWANWSEHLKDITYIGNSLSSYEYVKSVKDKKDDETNTIDILLPYFTEVFLALLLRIL